MKVLNKILQIGESLRTFAVGPSGARWPRIRWGKFSMILKKTKTGKIAGTVEKWVYQAEGHWPLVLRVKQELKTWAGENNKDTFRGFLISIAYLVLYSDVFEFQKIKSGVFSVKLIFHSEAFLIWSKISFIQKYIFEPPFPSLSSLLWWSILIHILFRRTSPVGNNHEYQNCHVHLKSEIHGPDLLNELRGP